MPDTEVRKEVDGKGVEWENRQKEWERKQAKYEEELATTKRELEAVKMQRTEVRTEIKEPDIEAKAKEDLMEFVKNPRGFLHNTFQETMFQSELPQVRPWLAGQKGYDSKVDDSRLLAIEQEYQLADPSPLKRAQTAWKIRQQEMAYEKLTSMTDDERREERARNNELEGTGKATSKEKTVTRADLIKKLAEAEAKGDLDKAIAITSMLEDVR